VTSHDQTTRALPLVTDNALAASLQQRVIERVPGTFCAVLASTDGILIAHVGVNGSDPVARAETLAAISTGRGAIGHELGKAFGDVDGDSDGSPGWGQGLDYFPRFGWVVTRRGRHNNVLVVGCRPETNLTTVGTVMEQLFHHLDPQLGTSERDQSIPAAQG
jgi:hypothetical protein